MTWIVDVDEAETRFEAPSALLHHLGTLRATPQGHFLLLMDRGKRSRWQTFVGLGKRDVSPCLTLEWADGAATLIFLDDSWSEYRAVDPAQPFQPSEATRRKISHGNFRPAPTEECIANNRAFDAVEHYITTGQRAPWLSYHFVR